MLWVEEWINEWVIPSNRTVTYKYLNMEWNKNLIGENAGIVWRTLHGSKMS